MAIVVEDGSIVTGANSYVSAADLTTYATARGITLTVSGDILLIKAMDYLESLSYIGIKRLYSQGLQWPRVYAMIDGYYTSSDVIPTELKNAQMQLAISIDEGNNPLATLSQAVKREKIDVIEVEYMDGSSAAPIIKTVSAMLWKLLSGGNGGNVIRVNKA